MMRQPISQPRESTTLRREGMVRSRTGFSDVSGRVVSSRMTKERTSAPIAALIASQSGIGRSWTPPKPWARRFVSTVGTSLNLEDEDRLVECVGLHVDRARDLEGVQRDLRVSDAVVDVLLRDGVHVDLTGHVGGDVEDDGLADLDVDLLRDRGDLASGERDLDDLAARRVRSLRRGGAVRCRRRGTRGGDSERERGESGREDGGGTAHQGPFRGSTTPVRREREGRSALTE